MIGRFVFRGRLCTMSPQPGSTKHTRIEYDDEPRVKRNEYPPRYQINTKYAQALMARGEIKPTRKVTT